MKQKLLTFFIMIIAWPLYADSVYILHDNDMPFHSDDRYSAGLQVGWISDSYSDVKSDKFDQAYIHLLSNIVEFSGISFDNRKRAGNISLQEMIITPVNLEKREPIYNDVPYMGLLSSSFSLLSWDNDDFDEYRFTIGLTGPNSGAQELQTFVHKIVGSIVAKGWDNQIGTRIVVQLGYVHSIKQFVKKFNDSKRFEWFNNYSVDIGNFYSGIGLGTSIRYGKNMPFNFENSTGLLVSTKSNMIELDHRSSSIGWDVHGGFHLNAIGYLYLYEESKRLGYDFDRPNLLPIVNVGTSAYVKNFSLALDFFPSKSTVTNPGSSSFARINFSWQF